jgi:hypothetical protein
MKCIKFQKVSLERRTQRRRWEDDLRIGCEDLTQTYLDQGRAR